MRVGKLENGKATGKDEITGKMIKGEGNKVVDWIWRLFNMAFENVLCRKTGNLLLSFYCTRVKEKGQNAAVIYQLVKSGWKNTSRDPSRQSVK